MANRTLPPQAYTREVLAEAYDWLRSQSPSTKELARDVNTLVSFYLQAKRHNKIKNMKSNEAVEFKQDLRNLAEGIKKFDEDKPSQSQFVNNFYEPNSTTNSQAPMKQDSFPNLAPPLAVAPVVTPPTPVTPPVSSPQVSPSGTIYQNPYNEKTLSQKEPALPAPKAPSQPVPVNENVERKNTDILKKTQELLNLSTEEEARSALLSMGFEQLKSIFKIEK